MGDTTYTGDTSAPRMMLHAARLALPFPPHQVRREFVVRDHPPGRGDPVVRETMREGGRIAPSLLSPPQMEGHSPSFRRMPPPFLFRLSCRARILSESCTPHGTQGPGSTLSVTTEADPFAAYFRPVEEG